MKEQWEQKHAIGKGRTREQLKGLPSGDGGVVVKRSQESIDSGDRQGSARFPGSENGNQFGKKA